MKIYLDKNCERFCVVDPIDYEWAMQWRWHAHPSKRRNKWYASRMVRKGNGWVRIFMHKEILTRSGMLPPSPAHHLGDHCDGNSLNNRRNNLRYATHSMNRRNIKGSAMDSVDASEPNIPF